ncbi:helix-turn-helix domain-containing protein [Phascolarctobacterium succinatutens]|uniref:helix-turn-helix domain-containing protein n=1 Tax=Phascolarctobacterium succinatutens TaxID=626940 RepID=UPI0025FDC29D|nr:helix-turn-helix transcriptional regulator [Phascolarctobacterium succinatutens]
MDNAEERQRIGDTIRQARKNKKITQTQLGAEIGIGKVAVANYESGKIKVIPFEKRVKLADLLDIPLNALLYTDEKSTDTNCCNSLQQYIKAVGGVVDERDIDNIAAILDESPIAKFSKHLLEVSAPYPLAQAVQIIIAGIDNNEKYSGAVDLLQATLTRLFYSRGLTTADAESLANYFGDAYIKSFSQ